MQFRNQIHSQISRLVGLHNSTVYWGKNVLGFFCFWFNLIAVLLLCDFIWTSYILCSLHSFWLYWSPFSGNPLFSLLCLVLHLWVFCMQTLLSGAPRSLEGRLWKPNFHCSNVKVRIEEVWNPVGIQSKDQDRLETLHSDYCRDSAWKKIFSERQGHFGFKDLIVVLGEVNYS